MSLYPIIRSTVFIILTDFFENTTIKMLIESSFNFIQTVNEIDVEINTLSKMNNKNGM